ncbi:hypothetical protein C4K18_3910 [Pseudomonas chlororaphis subsp. aurantiaca]|nr:hypothetical protein C4K18_3910 [Pseudomonas chlororaphis subsp. aurantiaca]
MLVGILRALETLRVYRSLAGSAAATGNGDALDIPVGPDVWVAAAAGCDRAARSWGSCGRRRPCGSIAASRGSAAATGNGDALDIPVGPDVCVAAAAGCDRAARSWGPCGRWRPCGSIAASRARQRLQGMVTPSIFGAGSMFVAAAAGCDRAARSWGSCGRWRPCGSIAASRARQRLQGMVTPSIFRSGPMFG